MPSSKLSSAFLVTVLLAAGLAIGCSSVEGNYRDSDGLVNLELKGGKCNLSMGLLHIPCTYKVDGDKVTLSPTEGDKRQTIVLTLKDGALVGPPGAMFGKLEKVK